MVREDEWMSSVMSSVMSSARGTVVAAKFFNSIFQVSISRLCGVVLGRVLWVVQRGRRNRPHSEGNILSSTWIADYHLAVACFLFRAGGIEYLFCCVVDW